MLTIVGFAAVLLVAAGVLSASHLFFVGTVWLVLSPVLYPFVRYPHTDALLTFDRMCLAVLLVGLVVTHERRPRVVGVRGFTAAAAVFAGVFFLRAATTTGGVLGALQTFVDAVLLPCVVFAVCRRTAHTPERLRAWAAGLMVCGSVVGLIGITERVSGYELASLSGGTARVDHEVGGIVRVSGPYSVPEPYALVLALTLAATLFWWMSGRRAGGARRSLVVDVAGPVLAAVQIAGMALSLFRVAWACAVLTLVMVLGLRSSRRIRLAVVGTTVALVALVLLVPLQSSDVFRERMGNTDNVAGRLATHMVGVEIFASAPLTGVGVNQFVAAQREKGVQQVWGVRSVDSPHSSFLGTLTEQGLVGFTALIATCVCCVRMLRRLALVARGDPLLEVLRAAALAGAVSYLVFSLELTMLPLGPSNAVFAVLLGLAAAAVESGRQRSVVQLPASDGAVAGGKGTGSAVVGAGAGPSVDGLPAGVLR